MNKKLWYLIKLSLNKKIRTKWFLIANLLFSILIIGLLNIDSIVKFFGGDFEHETIIYVLDNTNSNMDNSFENIFKEYNNYFDLNYEIKSINNYDEGYDIVEKEEENKNIMLVINNDINNYISSKLVSKKGVDNSMYQVITSSLNAIKRDYALNSLGISKEDMKKIESVVEVESINIDKDARNNSNFELITSVLFPILELPLFLLTIFLIQMIGAEINEEKSTRGMEIIISNVSPKTHFLSKLISGNIFVLLQGLLLLFYSLIGSLLRILFTGSANISKVLDSTGINFIEILNETGIMDNLGVIIIMVIIFVILSFVGCSLVSAITASMTTNMEDYQQVQTPIVMINLIGFYLSMMASLFEGSSFIKFISYCPFVSTMLSPVLFSLGQIGIFDVIISMLVMLFVIYLLVKYGLRIYKEGILNYSSTNIWKRMFKALKNKS